MLRKILQPFYTAWVLSTFLVFLLVAFPVFVLISLGNNAKARHAIYVFIKYFAKVWLWLIGMPVSVEGAPKGKERYVVIANHISYLDSIVLFVALKGYFRPLGKKEMSKIPVFGFVYKNIAIMVDRSSERSRTKSMRLMWRAIKHECSIALFPEGTFNETPAPFKEFYNGAFRLAINTQTPILPLLLPDTVDRWHYSAWWKLWPGKNRAIFLPPVEVIGMKMEEVQNLNKQVFELMDAGIRKYRKYKSA